MAHASGTVMASEVFLFKGCDAAVVCCTSRVGFLPRLADGVDRDGLQNEQVAPARDAGEPPPPLLPPLLPPPPQPPPPQPPPLLPTTTAMPPHSL